MGVIDTTYNFGLIFIKYLKVEIQNSIMSFCSSLINVPIVALLSKQTDSFSTGISQKGNVIFTTKKVIFNIFKYSAL